MPPNRHKGVPFFAVWKIYHSALHFLITILLGSVLQRSYGNTKRRGYLEGLISTSLLCVHFAIYRSPSRKATPNMITFLEEFNTFSENFMLSSRRLLMVVGLNFYVN